MSEGVPAGASLEHATVVEIDRRGVMIRGASGSGKTALAIELLFRCRTCDIASMLVADDYAFLSRDEASVDIAAVAPQRIAGRIEFRGLGIVPVAPARLKPETRLALAVSLRPAEDCERVADPDRRALIHGVALPELVLAERQPVSAACAVLGWLGLSQRIL